MCSSDLPDVSLLVLRDMADVARSKVFLSLLHGNRSALVVGIHDAQTVALSYPHDFIV